MIQANELRIGNIAQDDKGNFLTIESGDIVAIKVKGENGFKYLPIDLTPELLEMCGFAKVANELTLLVYEGYVSISYLFNSFPLVLDIDGNRMPLYNIKYLHQLQNLYFALTGEELTINL